MPSPNMEMAFLFSKICSLAFDIAKSFYGPAGQAVTCKYCRHSSVVNVLVTCDFASVTSSSIGKAKT
jgi:hypothetical protein